MYQKYFKRAFDFILSFIGLIIISLLLLLIIIVLYFANKGAGVFFTQERPGKNATLFKIFKFKSMTNEKDAEGNLLPNEQRITKVGKFIRSTSIDELPQLVNVLIGDMSIVGPRPLPIRYLELYSEEQAKRQNVLPGITGWAQVNGRNNISWTKKFEYDVWYVNNMSLLLDLKICCTTVIKIIKKSDINTGNDKVGGVGYNGHN